ncbi:uncharacterized protein LOC126769742 [Nymphalis io]|uniref:uncharacterized protein LOC126769742 n=1 Tax=Inachis io TaxID=171585 RepID=UPI002168041B|nr:uncharacterized protein LOC126769742 [Nymphalis io]
MSIGIISEFQVNSDDWYLYVERLEQYLIVNRIPNELYVPTLITVIGSKCYELLVSLCTPDKPSSKSFKQLIEILGKHLQPKPSILAERFKFRQRIQINGESISEYTAELKKMSKTCEFGSWLEESLRDQLVCGLSSDVIRQRIFAEEHLDFKKAYQLAVNMEAAERNTAAVDSRIGNSNNSTVACQAMAGAWRDKSSGMWRTKYQQGRVDNTIRRNKPNNSLEDEINWRREKSMPSALCRVCNRRGHIRRVCPNMTGQYNIVDSL